MGHDQVCFSSVWCAIYHCAMGTNCTVIVSGCWNKADRFTAWCTCGFPPVMLRHENSVMPKSKSFETARDNGVSMMLQRCALFMSMHPWYCVRHTPNRLDDPVQNVNRDLGCGDYIVYEACNRTCCNSASNSWQLSL